jgi:hypothetical protein
MEMTQLTDVPAALRTQRPIDGSLSRRQALLHLGLASAVAYAVPTLIHLDRAQAHVSPSNCKFLNKKYCK